MGSAGQGTGKYNKAASTGESGSKTGKGGDPPLVHPSYTAGDREVRLLDVPISYKGCRENDRFFRVIQDMH